MFKSYENFIKEYFNHIKFSIGLLDELQDLMTSGSKEHQSMIPDYELLSVFPWVPLAASSLSAIGRNTELGGLRR